MFDANKKKMIGSIGNFIWFDWSPTLDRAESRTTHDHKQKVLFMVEQFYFIQFDVTGTRETTKSARALRPRHSQPECVSREWAIMNGTAALVARVEVGRGKKFAARSKESARQQVGNELAGDRRRDDLAWSGGVQTGAARYHRLRDTPMLIIIRHDSVFMCSRSIA